MYCRCVLAASSPYFKATFSNEFQEAINARVVLHDVSPWIMKRILDYVYSGKLEVTLENAQDYLRTGHMLDYPAIVQVCSELLAEHLHTSNCLGIKEFASMFGCVELERLAYDFATENFATVVDRGEELSELSLESLVGYLSSDNIDIANEMVLWTAIRDWISYESDERKIYLTDLLRCMRLTVLSFKELSTILNDPIVRGQPKCVQLIEKVKKRSSEHIIHPGPGDGQLIEGVTTQNNLKLQGYQVGLAAS